MQVFYLHHTYDMIKYGRPVVTWQAGTIKVVLGLQTQPCAIKLRDVKIERDYIHDTQDLLPTQETV